MRSRVAVLARHPLGAVLLLKLFEVLCAWLARKRRLVLDRRCLQTRWSDDIDSELLQGSLLSTENLLSLGRVEKRTLWSRPLLEVLGGNLHLRDELMRAAAICRSSSRNCMVTRWIPADERYHVLQSSLNSMSSLFGTNYVHFNAMAGEAATAFRPTWFCLTVMTSTRQEEPASKRGRAKDNDNNATFEDMSRKPRATLRVALVNESELRRIGDGKIAPPSWGFFNARHAERYRMLQDFARNFQKQLLKTPTDGKAKDSRNPFTSERAHREKPAARPDGGMMKRIHSVPHMKGASGNLATLHKSQQGTSSSDLSSLRIRRGGGRAAEAELGQEDEDEGDAGEDDACFLRLHVPHFVGTSVIVSRSGADGKAGALPKSGSLSQLSSMASGGTEFPELAHSGGEQGTLAARQPW